MNIAATSALAITAGSAIAGYSSGDARDTAITTLALLTGLVMVIAVCCAWVVCYASSPIRW